MKLHEKINTRENNFDFLRFFAASLVIISHTFPLFGSQFEPFVAVAGYTTFGGLAVYIFFTISGFLITKSWFDNPGFFIFAYKRFLRIFPGLIAAVFFGALIVGPLATKLSVREYLTHPQTMDYLKNVFLFPIRYYLPGVFTDNPYQNAVNGSLWTLSIEFIMYVFVAVFGVLGILKRKWLIAALILAMLFLDMHILPRPEYQSLVIFYMKAADSLKCAIFFLLGSFFYLNNEKISLNPGFALLAMALYFISFRTQAASIVGYLALPYLILFFAFSDYPFRKFGKYGDFSYGMYVYAFPVQQSVMWLGARHLSIWGFFALSYLFTLALSAVSWHLIEKQALRLKPYRKRRAET